MPNQTFKHTVAFVVGFGLVFIALGLSVSVLGRWVAAYLPALQRIGGVVLIFFGLATMGIFRWLSKRVERSDNARVRPASSRLQKALAWPETLIYADRRAHLNLEMGGYPASFLTGIIFAAGWTPCIGPILSAILLLATEQQSIAQGGVLLVFYSLGLAVPLLVAGAALDAVRPVLQRVNQYGNVVALISGLLLIGAGWLMVSDQLLSLSAELITRFGLGIGLESTLSVGAAGVSFPLAFAAGLLSFFSPCILPLIPAYLSYLGGTTVNPQFRPAATSVD